MNWYCWKNMVKKQTAGSCKGLLTLSLSAVISLMPKCLDAAKELKIVVRAVPVMIMWTWKQRLPTMYV